MYSLSASGSMDGILNVLRGQVTRATLITRERAGRYWSTADSYSIVGPEPTPVTGALDCSGGGARGEG